MSNTQQDIERVCNSVRDLLLSKNRKYGDSALEPVRVMSQSTPVEQILVRIDDKLSRISRGAGLLASDEDVVTDLIGYFVLLKIALERDCQNAFKEELTKPIKPIRNMSASLRDHFKSTKPIPWDSDETWMSEEKHDVSYYDRDRNRPYVDECGWDESSGPSC